MKRKVPEYIKALQKIEIELREQLKISAKNKTKKQK